ncbi:MAG TPA: hypothetical protein VGJ84_00135, partial [Polyangiaceae bacterium]
CGSRDLNSDRSLPKSLISADEFTFSCPESPWFPASFERVLGRNFLRGADESEKAHPAERYYEPNFPVIKEDEAAELCGLCDELAD